MKHYPRCIIIVVGLLAAAVLACTVSSTGCAYRQHLRHSVLTPAALTSKLPAPVLTRLCKRVRGVHKPPVKSVRYRITPLLGINVHDGVFLNNSGMVAASGTGIGKFWRNGKTWTIYNPLHDPSFSDTYVSGINDAGTVIGTFRNGYNTDGIIYSAQARVFMWHAGRVTVLPPTDKLDNSVPSAIGISKTGDVLVRVTWQSPLSDESDDEGHKTYLYHAGKYQLLPQNKYPPASEKDLYRENSQGKFVSVADPFPTALFSGASYEMLDINRTGVSVGSASRQTSDSIVIGNSRRIVEALSTSHTDEEDDTVTHAYIMRNGNMTDLNTLVDARTGWVLHEADAINDRGQIVCTGNKGACLLTPLSHAAKRAETRAQRRKDIGACASNINRCIWYNKPAGR